MLYNSGTMPRGEAEYGDLRRSQDKDARQTTATATDEHGRSQFLYQHTNGDKP